VLHSQSGLAASPPYWAPPPATPTTAAGALQRCAAPIKRGHVAYAVLLNPVVRRAPGMAFRSHVLQLDAKALLEAALMEANREREKRIMRGD
jgi:hypothetical protein